ncbi:MAG: phosphatidylglycerophosphatase A [Opitutaceae bacterium]|nr:phosphatidylglycerophosphatase A [Opitutaceae bacterium]
MKPGNGQQTGGARRTGAGWVVSLATLGPLGRKLPAPGTWGALAGTAWFALFFRETGTAALAVWSLATALAAVAVCGGAERRLARRDPGCVVLDEFVAMPLCFLNWRAVTVADIGGWTPPFWAVLAAGFLLFRFFDILKPLGISRLQDLPGGWGVVADDIAAALAACASLHVLTAVAVALAR